MSELGGAGRRTTGGAEVCAVDDLLHVGAAGACNGWWTIESRMRVQCVSLDQTWIQIRSKEKGCAVEGKPAMSRRAEFQLFMHGRSQRFGIRPVHACKLKCIQNTQFQYADASNTEVVLYYTRTACESDVAAIEQLEIGNIGKSNRVVTAVPGISGQAI